MYSHCLFCNGALGSNESIEQFPVGRRLAFDSEKGRLWVVCPACRRWNLTPIEQRWEAVETAERLFRGQRLRAQTDNIGLAKLREGTELVRIGHALRPEFAAWRYGRIFGARLRRRVTAIGGGTVAVAAGGALLAGAPAIGVIAPFLAVLGYVLLPLLTVKGRLVATKVVGENGKILRVYLADLEETQLLGGEGDDPWRFMLRHSYGRQELTGERARRALGAILARVNRGGAAAGTVVDATSIVAEAGSPERVAATIAGEAMKRRGDFDEWLKAHRRGDYAFVWNKPASMSNRDWLLRQTHLPTNRGAIPRLPAPLRLALEMALHEGSERAALEGELALLESAWREAEEIAGIADNLLPPKGAQEFIERHRREK